MNDWDDLRYFLATAREGSLTRAAQMLGVNHSTVSRRISAFEDKLGARLFDRSVSGFVVTQAGQEMMQTAMRIEKEITLLDRQMLSRDMTMTGRLRIATPAALIATFLMPHIASFSLKYPSVEIDIQSSDTLINLHNHEADIAIRSIKNPSESLMGRRLTPVAKAIYASSSYLERHGCCARSIRDGIQHRWVQSKSNNDVPAWVLKHFPSAQIGCRVNTLLARIQAVKHGIGIGELHCRFGDSDPELHRIYPFETVLDTDFWVLYHPDLRHTARVRAFTSHIAEAFNRERDLYAGKITSVAPAGILSD